MTQISDCLKVVTIPCCNSTITTTGSTTVPDMVLYNSVSVANITTPNSWQSFSPSKTYSVPLDKLSIGDRIKVEAVGKLALDSLTSDYAGIRLLFDNNIIGEYLINFGQKYGYYKIQAVIEVVDVTGASNNMSVFTTCSSSFSDPTSTPRSADITIFESALTIDYATTPAKIIVATGIVDDAVTATQYSKLQQLTIEHYNKS